MVLARGYLVLARGYLDWKVIDGPNGIFSISDGGKPGFFQNPGSGSNPGFEMNYLGFPGNSYLLRIGPSNFH